MLVTWPAALRSAPSTYSLFDVSHPLARGCGATAPHHSAKFASVSSFSFFLFSPLLPPPPPLFGSFFLVFGFFVVNDASRLYVMIRHHFLVFFISPQLETERGWSSVLLLVSSRLVSARHVTQDSLRISCSGPTAALSQLLDTTATATNYPPVSKMRPQFVGTWAASADGRSNRAAFADDRPELSTLYAYVAAGRCEKSDSRLRECGGGEATRAEEATFIR